MAGWIKISIGMEVGFDPGDFVLDGDPAPPQKKAQPPPAHNFRPMSIVAKWLDGSRCQNWYGGRPRPMPHCVRRGPSSARRKRGTAAPLFSAHVYCGYGRQSQRLPSSCVICYRHSFITYCVWILVFQCSMYYTTLILFCCTCFVSGQSALMRFNK